MLHQTRRSDWPSDCVTWHDRPKSLFCELHVVPSECWCWTSLATGSVFRFSCALLSSLKTWKIFISHNYFFQFRRAEISQFARDLVVFLDKFVRLCHARFRNSHSFVRVDSASRPLLQTFRSASGLRAGSEKAESQIYSQHNPSDNRPLTPTWQRGRRSATEFPTTC